MTGKEIVKRAIDRTGPSRVPILYFNKDTEKSDIVLTGYGEALDFPYKGSNISEWGFVWERMDDTMGQPKNHPIKSWVDYQSYIPPNADAPGRYDHLKAVVDSNPDRYILGSLGITGFNMVTFLRGFENSMEDLYLERECIEKLLDMVLEFESRVAEALCINGADGIAFGDDWGTQNSLMISPALWREVFKPRFKKQFDLVHRYGKHVYFHSCGYIYEIIPDLIEIGVDILNLNQPDIFGVERLGQDFGGKVCFCCPVDHQTVAITGNRDEIFDYVRRLRQNLGSFNGGFIGYIEEYHSIGMTDQNYKNIVDAFESIKCEGSQLL
jgi:uroporphyrinogen decarboxylase